MIVLSAAFVLCMLTVFRGTITRSVKSMKNTKVFIRTVIIVIVSVFILIQIVPLIRYALNEILERVQSTNDKSTQAHLQYYTSWPMIAGKQNILEFLF